MKIKTSILTIPGAPLEGVNPLPHFRDKKARHFPATENVPENLKKNVGTTEKVLPYLMQDRYSRKRIPLKLKMYTLENEYLKAEFLPEYGGRLYSLFDKVNNIDLVMKNPVIQPGNLAIRNAWLSGGIEWNIGSIGHTYTTCDNVFCAILDDGVGNEFLRIYEFERCTNVFWQIDFHLPENSKELFSHVKIINPFKEDTTTYWWTNIAVEDTGKTRVLSSCEDIILFMGGKLDYATLPYADAIAGVDISFPSNVTRGFDYFLQPRDTSKGSWEAAAYEDGKVFFERSTAPLLYRKMFCWGTHHGGKHWQEYLSDKGFGYYAEIQAGFAPSQLHDMVLKGGEILEWTQGFGGLTLDKDKLLESHLHDANIYLDQKIEEYISFEMLEDYDRMFKELANKETNPENIVHNASGWGALELKRMKQQNDSVIPNSFCFPDSTITSEQYPWLNLLEEGILPDEDVNYIPDSWIINPKWLDLIEKSLEKENGKTWFSLLHYGTALYEQNDFGKVAVEAENWDRIDEFEEKAKNAWIESIALKPSVWAYRNLAVTEKDAEKAIEYYQKAFQLDAAYSDFALSAEYVKLLCKEKKYSEAWDFYSSLPNNIKTADRVMIVVATAAVELKKLDFLKGFFEAEHFDIKEGETSLTELWFKYSAVLLAKSDGVENPTSQQQEEYIKKARKLCPPPEEIDFRMSEDDNEKYRVEE